MRIRAQFAGVFVLLSLLSAYLGLAKVKITSVNDKALHFITFFILSVCFYWVIDTSRRRTTNITLVVCTVVLGVGSEVVQHFVPNGRTFDSYDVLANIVGSGLGIVLCSWYHKRMNERKRRAKHYHVVPDDEDTRILNGDDDVELGERDVEADPGPPTLEEEVDAWDENAEDAWDDAEDEPKADEEAISK